MERKSTDTSADVDERSSSIPTRDEPSNARTPTQDVADAKQNSAAVDPRGEPTTNTIDESPVETSRRSASPVAAEARSTAEHSSTLLPNDRLAGFENRWREIQIGFVDEPRTAVRDAEALVNDMVKEVTDIFTTERQTLEKTWSSGGSASTEDLRVALQRYRSFFQRLLAV